MGRVVDPQRGAHKMSHFNRSLYSGRAGLLTGFLGLCLLFVLAAVFILQAQPVGAKTVSFQGGGALAPNSCASPSFGAAVNYPAANTTSAVAVGDFNGDSVLD